MKGWRQDDGDRDDGSIVVRGADWIFNRIRHSTDIDLLSKEAAKMRRSKQRRKTPPEKTFKYLIRCIGCSKLFLLGKKGADLSKLHCDVCSGKLEYSENTNRRNTPAKKRSKEMANAKKKVKSGSKVQVQELLRQLEQSNDKVKNRKTRAELRRLGHRGGLNHPRKKKHGAKKKATKGKKVTKKKKAKVTKKKAKAKAAA